LDYKSVEASTADATWLDEAGDLSPGRCRTVTIEGGKAAVSF
jgi:hypothetical protein